MQQRNTSRDVVSRYWNAAMSGRQEKRKRVFGTQQRSKARTEAHRERRKRDLNTEGGGGKQHLLPEPWLMVKEGELKTADAWWLLAPPEASTEKCTRGMEQWMQWTAIAVSHSQAHVPLEESNELVAILERGQLSSDLREAVGWLHPAALSVRVGWNRVQVNRGSRSKVQVSKRAHFKLAGGTCVSPAEQLWF